MLKRLNPFRGLPNPREVWAWGMYDLANQSFTLLIITLLFPVYLKNVVAPDPQSGDRAWSLIFSSSLLIVVLLSPIVGSLADARGWRKEFLVGSGVLCVAFTASLSSIGPSQIPLAATLFIAANLCYQIGENFLASFLPDVSTPRTIGRISAFGWTMGYVGALMLLIITAIIMQLFGIGNTPAWRPLFIFAAAWFVIAMIPTIRFLRDDRKPDEPPERNVLAQAIRRLVTTAAHARNYRQLVLFLSGFFVYALGVWTIISFAGILAEDFGFKQTRLVLFVLQLTVTAGIASFATAFFQDRIGAKVTILIYLGIWTLSALGLLAITLAPEPPEWTFWVIGNGIGFGLGGIGTSSRAMVGRFTPRHRSAEFFGLWGMVYKLAGAIGVATFGTVKASMGDANALALLAGFFVFGAVIVLFVSERAGVYAARKAERDHRQAPSDLGAIHRRADPTLPA